MPPLRGRLIETLSPCIQLKHRDLHDFIHFSEHHPRGLSRPSLGVNPLKDASFSALRFFKIPSIHFFDGARRQGRLAQTFN